MLPFEMRSEVLVPAIILRLTSVTGMSDTTGSRTIPASYKIRCIYPKKSSIATKLESRDHYIMENRPYPEFQSSKTLQ